MQSRMLLLIEENIFPKHAADALNLEDEPDNSLNSDNMFPTGTKNFCQETNEILCRPHMARWLSKQEVCLLRDSGEDRVFG